MKILGRYKAFCHPEWSWDSQMTHHYGYNLWYISQGKGKLTVKGTTYGLEPGACFVLDLRERHIAFHDAENPLVVPFVIFDEFDGDQTVPKRYRVINERFFFEKLMDKIINAENKRYALRWLTAALAMLVEEDEASSHKSTERQDKTDFIHDIAENVRLHPEETFEIDVIARKSRYSTDHFIRLFKEVTGMTPGQFVIRHKIKKACELLKMSSFSVQSIAELLGYQDIYTFSKQFKNKTGLSPKHYRQQI